MAIGADKPSLFAVVCATMRMLDDAARERKRTLNGSSVNKAVKVNPLAAIQ